MYTDLNGEIVRAQEWGLVITRLGPQYGVGDWPMRVPAEYFGDTGAASGALSIVLACRAYARGYAQGHRALALCSDEFGEHAAVLVTHGVT